MTGPKMAIRVINTPIIKFNVVAVGNNIFGFHLSNVGIDRFAIPHFSERVDFVHFELSDHSMH
jgi:hypothetical protein